MRAAAAVGLAALTALSLGGCASESSGYSTVDAHVVVLVPTGTGASSPVDGGALLCGARAEAGRLHLRLHIVRPKGPGASAQILVLDAVTATKPGGVVLAARDRDAVLAPVVSMRRAGIHVVELSADDSRRAGTARAGAVAVAQAAVRGDGARSVLGAAARRECETVRRRGAA